MHSFLQSTARASRVTWMVFLGFLVVGLAPLLAEGDNDPRQICFMPKGGGTGIVNLPCLAAGELTQAGKIGQNGWRHEERQRVPDGLNLQLASGDERVVASYSLEGATVVSELLEDFLHINEDSITAMRENGVQRLDILFVSPDRRYLRVQLEFHAGTEDITIRIE